MDKYSVWARRSVTAGGVCSYRLALNGQLRKSDFQRLLSEEVSKKMLQLASPYVIVRLSPCNTRTGERILMKLNMWQLYQKIVLIL
jgi:hypothetical protein